MSTSGVRVSSLWWKLTKYAPTIATATATARATTNEQSSSTQPQRIAPPPVAATSLPGGDHQGAGCEDGQQVLGRSGGVGGSPGRHHAALLHHLGDGGDGQFHRVGWIWGCLGMLGCQSIRV